MNKIICGLFDCTWEYNELTYDLKGRKILYITVRKCKRCTKSELIQIIESFPEHIYVDKTTGERLV